MKQIDKAGRVISAAQRRQFDHQPITLDIPARLCNSSSQQPYKPPAWSDARANQSAFLNIGRVGLYC